MPEGVVDVDLKPQECLNVEAKSSVEEKPRNPPSKVNDLEAKDVERESTVAESQGKQEESQEDGYRTFPCPPAPVTSKGGYCGSSSSNEPFCDNGISTSKYTLFNFVPKFLSEQFSKIANVYFLLIVILQIFPCTTISNGVPTVLTALGFVLVIELFKEAMEDIARHKADNEQNARQTQVADGPNWKRVSWVDVRVGDLVKIEKEEAIPADLVIISSDDDSGQCWVETKELDGETNLKPRWTVKSNAGITKWNEKKRKQYLLEASLRIERPSENLEEINGSTISVGSQQDIIEARNCIWRGSRMMSNYAHCVVIYTGEDSKLRLNAGETPSKMSSVDRMLDKMLKGLLFIEFSLAFFSGAAGTVANWDDGELWYLSGDRQGKPNGGQFCPTDRTRFIFLPFSFLLIYMYMVPIALYVSIACVKVIQKSFIQWDLELYEPEIDAPCLVRTSALNEELGRIHYIFSDKTGTLTANDMVLKRIFSGGQLFCERPVDEDGSPIKADKAHRNPLFENGEGDVADEIPHTDLEGAEVLKALVAGGKRAEQIEQFVLCMALCQGVTIESNIPAGPGGPHYSAVSPDELAMVYGAQACGCIFSEHKQMDGKDMIILERRGGGWSGEKQSFEVVATIDFNSARKRMSLLYKCHPSGEYVLYSKGADNVIEERLKANDPSIKAANDQVNELAREGLRTLFLTRRVLSTEMAADWLAKYNGAKESNDVDLLEKLEEELEKDLELLGCTGVEDKLQDQVPWALKTLLQADVKTWVLTGDKKDTAINIGQKCNLLQDHMSVITEWPDVAAIIGEDFASEGFKSKAELEAARTPDLLLHLRGALETRLILLDRQSSCIEKVMAVSALEHTKLLAGLRSLDPTERWALIGVAQQENNHDLAKRLKVAMDDRSGGKQMEWRDPNRTRTDTPMSPRSSRKAVITPQDILSPDDAIDNLAMVIDGPTLRYILPSTEGGSSIKELAAKTPKGDSDLSHAHVRAALPIHLLFLEIACQCLSIICCRVSPKQKSQIVELVRYNREGKITLAIGDGANDVPMIQAAHVGVGIRGKEGSQAVNASDYAIGTFRFLVRLMLVHGHYNYRRQVNLTMYMVYKGAVLVLPAFIYQFYNRISGQEMYEQSAYQMYNPLFTSLPIIIFGVFDEDVAREVILNKKAPWALKVYKLGQNDDLWGTWHILGWVASAVAHGIIIFFLPMGAAASHEMALYEYGVYTFSAVIVVVDLRVAQMMGRLRWTWLTWIVILGSMLLYFCYELLVDSEGFATAPPPLSDYTGVAKNAMKWADFWFGLLFCGWVCSMTGIIQKTLPVIFGDEVDNGCFSRAHGDGLVQEVLEKEELRKTKESTDSLHPRRSSSNDATQWQLDGARGMSGDERSPRSTANYRMSLNHTTRVVD